MVSCNLSKSTKVEQAKDRILWSRLLVFKTTSDSALLARTPVLVYFILGTFDRIGQLILCVSKLVP